MKATFSIFLAIIILASSIKELAIVLSFKIQQDYIAKNLCVERDIEDSECGGCCQLNKKLTEQHEEEKETLPSRKLTNTIDFFYTLKNETNLVETGSGLTYQYFRASIYSDKSTGNIFHPPKATYKI